ncbi:hypothetical protein DL766_004228 [Monosporascus sp. MC13-8B]|uniref:Uncharacterized protein n=1 Tax=Monosporascus cannonballus TaxID=155416 RepID=A0ABY0HF76_9PEZI|nr:hypothetical protein DL763_010540 [Monosporascus cannonballus]RYO92084.1 hypothetical protein DL762_001819 [Monosporascus cannonballus]RYP31849.1 hypothetical protein DL766_004228 [Monosporascus sp. MC13-8B]
MPAIIFKITAHRAPSADKLSLFSERLKRLTVPELREVILALCITGTFHGELQGVVLEVSEKSEIACKRATIMVEKIIGAHGPKPEQVKKAKGARPLPK